NDRHDLERRQCDERQRDGVTQERTRAIHFASVALTFWPSVTDCLPATMTTSPAAQPLRISTFTPSSNPVATETFCAFPSRTTNREFLFFSVTNASAGMSSAFWFFCSSISTLAHIPGRSARSGFEVSISVVIVLVDSSNA